MNSKEFEEKLQFDNFEELENEYQQTKNFFEHLQEKIKSDDVKSRFPAFCFCNQEVRIKYPTYKIRIIDSTIDQKKLEELLKGQGIFGIYKETNVVKIPSLECVYPMVIQCLDTNLDANICTADKIEKVLKEKNIASERCVESAHYIIPIHIDEAGYIQVLNNENQ